MITRDFIVRQIHQLTQVIAAVLFHKRAGRQEEAQQMLAEGLEDVLGLPLGALLELGRDDLLDLCGQGESFSADKALAVADLLREEDSDAGRQRALWLYEAAHERGDIVPFDIHDRIADLRDALEG